MEAQFRRLAVLISIVSFVGFGAAAAWSFYQANSIQMHVSMYYGYIHKCMEDRTSVFCESLESDQRKFDSVVIDRDQYSSRAEAFLIATLIAPISSPLLYFAGRWVVTGQRPAWLVQEKSKIDAKG